MKKTVLFIFILSNFASFSQDIDLYKVGKNDNFENIDINSQMQFDEFKYLTQTLRMQDMMYAMVVPGYVHFKTGKKNTGYTMLAARTVGYGAFAYAAINVTQYLDFNQVLKFKKYDEAPELDSKKGLYIASAATGIVLIFGTYFYDWIHGREILLRKQDMIRYKYAVKLNLSSDIVNINNKIYPSLGLGLSF